MTNNRLYLRCKNCGKSMLVAKNFGSEWDYRNANKIPELNIKIKGGLRYDKVSRGRY